jgi:hypothetical protein
MERVEVEALFGQADETREAGERVRIGIREAQRGARLDHYHGRKGLATEGAGRRKGAGR